jgi:Glyoxalase-like domain
VPEPKAGKVRIHLEVTVVNVEGAIGLVAGLAGRAAGERHDCDAGAVVVMTDPDGHEFCLVQYYSEASAPAAGRY